MALSLKIATASMSREISLVNDYEDVTTRYVLEQLLILAGNDQSDFSESPLRPAGTSPIDGGGQRIAVSPLLIS